MRREDDAASTGCALGAAQLFREPAAFATSVAAAVLSLHQRGEGVAIPFAGALGEAYAGGG